MMVMRFPAKKNAVAQKHRAISRQEKMAFSTPGQVALGLLQSLYGRTLTSQPKFFGLIDFQTSLAMKLRSAPQAPL